MSRHSTWSGHSRSRSYRNCLYNISLTGGKRRRVQPVSATLYLYSKRWSVSNGLSNTNQKHLPPRMQEKRGVFYHTIYIDKKLKWFRLSDNYSEALRMWTEREGAAVTKGSTVTHMVDRYVPEQTLERYDLTPCPKSWGRIIGALMFWHFRCAFRWLMPRQPERTITCSLF